MASVELEMGPEGPVCQKVVGRSHSRLSFKDTLALGEEEEDFLCVSAEMET